MKMKTLNPDEIDIIINKGTEAPFTGEYNLHFEKGNYACKQCGAILYHSNDKFNSNCGWPSFDNSSNNMVKQVPDSDGKRTEILCNTCDAHLGHIFKGENYTSKNVRHCVNSISLKFESE